MTLVDRERAAEMIMKAASRFGGAKGKGDAGGEHVEEGREKRMFMLGTGSGKCGLGEKRNGKIGRGVVAEISRAKIGDIARAFTK